MGAAVKAFFQVINFSACISSAFTKTKIQFLGGLVNHN
jgi:hypothetical protein